MLALCVCIFSTSTIAGVSSIIMCDKLCFRHCFGGFEVCSDAADLTTYIRVSM